MLKLLCLWIILLHVNLISCQYTFPELQFEAYEPSGFRVSIPADDGIQMFNFHGNLNKKINGIDPGEFEEDITKPENNLWSYKNSDIKLQVGDKISYWVFIQHNSLGYKKIGELQVTKLIKPSETKCNAAQTLLNGRQDLCVNQVIFSDDFTSNELDRTKWTVEQYIPNNENFEFVYYQPKACAVQGEKLVITPKVLTEDEMANGLDLKNGCTRTDPVDCFQKNNLPIPPVKSGKITSNFKFTYGSVEIKAKLPKGDWVFPEIYLEMSNPNKERIYIAYARGNVNLNKGGEDISGKKLYGGPTYSLGDKFKNLISTTSVEPFCNEFHVYKLRWTPSVMELFVDGAKYGETQVTPTLQNNAKLVIGVSAGGLYDFPGRLSQTKPWSDADRLNRLTFHNARNTWEPTWTDPSLQIEYVKIRAV